VFSRLSGIGISNSGRQESRIERSKWRSCQVTVEFLIMNDQTLHPRSTAAREPEIELLAREAGVPVETVQEIYQVELDKLESSARIKTFVPVLAHRRVKARLQVEHGKRH
jgi:Protein of unknown function (DUF3562)